MTEKIIYLDDSPDIKHDFFAIHTNIAETLFDAIKNHKLQKGSFTAGLFGEWGSGKTFIIHKLKEKITSEPSPNITFLYIDVWKYSDQPLLRSILFELDRQLKELAKGNPSKYSDLKDGYKNHRGKSLQNLLYYDEIFESESKLTSEEFYKALKQLFSKYKWPFIILGLLFVAFICFQFIPSAYQERSWFKILDPILKGIAGFGGFIGATAIFLGILKKPLKDLGELVFFRNTVKNFTEKANFSPEQFEQIFRDMLSKIKNERYVIVFDNIDRCEPKVAYETLSTIKTYMDVDNCFYIIACDDEAIKNYLSSSTLNSNAFSRQFAEEFIDKIFQTYIRIPNLKEIERDKYIEEQLNKIDFGERLKEADIDIIKEILYYAYRGETPRNIKRFINDYSSYYRLVLKAYPELLEDITLFTVMIAIKQKWYQFEKILLEKPTFFKDYLKSKETLDSHNSKIEDFANLKSFLEHIEFYIKSFQEKPVDGYIYFKKSEPSIEIANKLRNGEFDINLNDETLKILLKEFEKNAKGQKAFALNSFVAMAHLIEQYKTSPFYSSLLKEFWKNFESASVEHSLIIEKLYKEQVLPLIINSLNDLDISRIRNTVEDIFVNCIKKPSNGKEEEIAETYESIFKIMFESSYKFPEKKVKTIFNNWDIEDEYLNRLLAIIDNQKKYTYLPDQILDRLVGEVKRKPQEAIEILRHWGHSRIPKAYGHKLVEVFVERLKQRNNAVNNPQQLDQQWAEIEVDYNLLLLIDDKFITDKNADPFVETLLLLITKIFQYGTHNANYVRKNINFWLEAAWFSQTQAKQKIDAKLKDLFAQHIANNQANLDYFSKELRYPEKILALPATKSEIFKRFKKIQRQIYEMLDEQYLSDFELLFAEDVEKSDAQILFEVAKARQIELNIAKLIHFLLDKAIGKGSKIAVVLEYLSQQLNLSEQREQFISRSNGIIDLYKKDPAEGYRILAMLKSIMPKDEFNRKFMFPLLKYLSSELEATRSVAKYNNIANLLDITEVEEELKKLAFRIFEECLAKDQEIAENNLGLQLLIKISSFLREEELDKAKKIIADNENRDNWHEQIKEQLVKRQLLPNEKRDKKDQTM